MAINWAEPTDALGHVDAGLKIVANLMKLVKPGAGKPNASERAVFAAAVVFSYGIWENYVEQLALELAGKVAPTIKPEKVPSKIRKSLETKTAWELSVSPGWRFLWVDTVKARAVGNDADKFGMNTARVGQVAHLLELAGVGDAFNGIPAGVVPAQVGAADVKDAVDRLVTLRGEIVHTGKVPNALTKGDVTAWATFVESLTAAMDETCREQCEALLT